MTEASLFSRLRGAVDGMGYRVHLQRIENSAGGDGLPDVNGCYDGRDFWIELKVKPGSVFRQLRPKQKAWIFRRVRAGGIVYILHGQPGKYTVYCTVIQANELVLEQISFCSCLTPKDAMDTILMHIGANCK